MKKVILGLSLAVVFVSCHKVQEGSNKQVLRLDDSQRGSEGFPYSGDAQGLREKQLPAATGAKATDSLKATQTEHVSVSHDSTSAAPHGGTAQ